MTPSAKILADSISPEGHRLTTFEVTMHRFVLAEFNTHRVLSRNSASSRAIPFEKQVARIEDNLAFPVSWPAEQKGMQGGDELPVKDIERALELWEKAGRKALAKARKLHRLGVHKSVVNRLLEPFMYHTAVVTGTAWWNFMDQRCSPLAQPEIKAVADQMREAYEGSEPITLSPGEFHLPYLSDAEIYDITYNTSGPEFGWPYACKVSSARCARTSYLTQNGERDFEEDVSLYERLMAAQPKHWSPLEHVATPWKQNVQHDGPWLNLDGQSVRVNVSHLPKVGNLTGWCSTRTIEEVKMGDSTYR